MAPQALNLLSKRIEILKAVVDRSEAHIGDLIQVPQFLHDEVAQGARAHFALAQRAQFVTNAAHRLLESLTAHGTFLERLLHAGAQLRLIKGYATAVSLDDQRQHEFRCFEGAEALSA